MSENDFLQWFCISCHPLSSPQTLHRAWKQNGNCSKSLFLFFFNVRNCLRVLIFPPEPQFYAFDGGFGDHRPVAPLLSRKDFCAILSLVKEYVGYIPKRFETKESLTSVMVMTGVDAMAAFLRMKPTFSFFKNSS